MNDLKMTDKVPASGNQSINLLANCAKKRIMEDNKSIYSTVTGYQKSKYAHLSW